MIVEFFCKRVTNSGRNRHICKVCWPFHHEFFLSFHMSSICRYSHLRQPVSHIAKTPLPHSKLSFFPNSAVCSCTQRFMIVDTSTNTNLATPWNQQLSKINQLGFTRDSWQFHSGPIFYRFSFISSYVCVWDTNNSLYQSTSTPRT